MIKVRDFHINDLFNLNDGSECHYTHINKIDKKEYIPFIKMCHIVKSLTFNDKVLVIALLLIDDERNTDIHFLMDKEFKLIFKNHKLRIMKDLLALFNKLEYNIIQSTCYANDNDQSRFLEFFGFKKVALLRGASHTHEDLLLYKKVK